jgi:hypothetical protein
MNLPIQTYDKMKIDILSSVRKVVIGVVEGVSVVEDVKKNTLDVTILEYDLEFGELTPIKNIDGSAFYITNNTITPENNVFNVPIMRSNLISPYQKGDHVIILCTDYAFKDGFYDKGGSYEKDVALIHSLSNAIVIGKIDKDGNLLNEEGELYAHDRVILKDKEAHLVIKDNRFKFENSNTDIKELMNNILDKMSIAITNAISVATYDAGTGTPTQVIQQQSIANINLAIKTQVDLLKIEIDKLFYK